MFCELDGDFVSGDGILREVYAAANFGTDMVIAEKEILAIS